MFFDLLKQNKCIIFALTFQAKVGRTPMRGLRGALLLGNADNGANAGSLYLNGNNAVSAANANRGAFLNKAE